MMDVNSFRNRSLSITTGAEELALATALATLFVPVFSGARTPGAGDQTDPGTAGTGGCLTGASALYTDHTAFTLADSARDLSAAFTPATGFSRRRIQTFFVHRASRRSGGLLYHASLAIVCRTLLPLEPFATAANLHPRVLALFTGRWQSGHDQYPLLQIQLASELLTEVNAPLFDVASHHALLFKGLPPFEHIHLDPVHRQILAPVPHPAAALTLHPIHKLNIF